VEIADEIRSVAAPALPRTIGEIAERGEVGGPIQPNPVVEFESLPVTNLAEYVLQAGTT
jgi:hypothetical protein